MKAIPHGPHKVRLLLVDDEADILFALKQVFQDAFRGAEILTAASGRAALEILKKGPVDIIISDYRMPEMDGLEFLKRSLEYAPEASRMILTAFPKMELAISAINDVTIDKFLVKPVPADAMIKNVEALLARRGSRAERVGAAP